MKKLKQRMMYMNGNPAQPQPQPTLQVVIKAEPVGDGSFAISVGTNIQPGENHLKAVRDIILEGLRKIIIEDDKASLGQQNSKIVVPQLDARRLKI